MADVQDLMKLINEGKTEEALAIVKEQRAKVRYAPDTIEDRGGKPPRFTKKGEAVELAEDGTTWRLKKKK